jgi:nitroreductase
MTDLYGTMSTLRAVRRLRPDPISSELINRIVQAACWAPTGGNTQPWRVVVVKDPKRKLALQEMYSDEWHAFATAKTIRLAEASVEEQERFTRTRSAGDYLAANMHHAPALLVFCADLSIMSITDINLERTSIVGGASVYPAVQNALLACAAEGIGCTLTTLLCQREIEVMKLLEIPSGWATAAVVPIGYPVGGGHGTITRRPPSSQAFLDRFGAPWPDADS